MAEFDDFEKTDWRSGDAESGRDLDAFSSRNYEGDNGTFRNSGQRPYRPRFNNNGGENRPYRPRFNANGDQGEYDNQRPYRPRFNPNGQRNNDGYGQRPYRPRFNPSDGRNTGGDDYSPRPYRPRFNQNGEQNNMGYSNRGVYSNNRGGYGNRGNYGAQNSYGGRGSYNGYGQRNLQKRRPANNVRPLPKRRTAFQEKVEDPDAPIRLNKYLANSGVCSRRDADKYIEAGVVTVNGATVTELGTKVQRTDEVRFHDQLVKPELKIYVLLNKPKGYVTTSEDPQNRKTVMDLVRNACPERIYPVGRLDRNTTGVMLLTNDGEMASKLTHPKFEKKKIYHVFLDQNLSAADMQKIAEGIMLEDGEIKADEIQYAHPTDKKQVGIEIHSGKNRIVRRIFDALGYHVTKLDRVYFAGLTKKRLRRGDWRYLTEEEVNFLRMGSFE